MADITITAGQEAIWLDQETHVQSPLYNVGGHGFLEGHLDQETMFAALRMLIEESVALRLVPRRFGTMSIAETVISDIEEDDLRTSSDPRAEVLARWRHSFEQPFNLRKPSPLGGSTCIVSPRTAMVLVSNSIT